MEYNVMIIEECSRCKQFESDHKFKNCSFTITGLDDGKVIQEFECSRCNFKWERIYESSTNYGSALRREAGQSELFESHREILP